MAEFTVSDDIISSSAAAEYFARADKRVLIGVRATLEMLEIPVPQYAVRRPPGRPPSRAVADAFAADHGKTRPQRPVSQDPLGEHRLAAAVAKAAARAAKTTNP
jgi:hypothetical protein